MINKAARRRVRDMHGLFTTNFGLRNQHQYQGHEANHLH